MSSLQDGYARWRSGWLLALRTARRDARSHRAASLLIVLMVALPVLILTAGIVTFTSLQSTPANTLTHTLGASQARIDHLGKKALQDFTVSNTGWSEEPATLPGTTPGERPTRADLERVTGGRLVPITRTTGFFADGHGTQPIIGIDGRERVAEGIVRLVSGRLPEQPGEAVVTPRAVRQGLAGDGELTLRIDQRPLTVRIVGVAEGRTDTGKSAYLVTLPATLHSGSTPGVAPDAKVDRTHSFLLDRREPVPWSEVRRLNDHGLLVYSRAVVEAPPPPSELPAQIKGAAPGADRSLSIVIIGSAAILLETMLLAGPAFAVSATRQRHSLALAAVNGATARQLRRYLLGQALVLGGGSAALAAALGVPLAWGVLAGARALGHDLPDRPLSVPIHLVAAVVLCAILAAVIAAAIPARGLTRLDLVTALRGRAPTNPPRRRVSVVGLVLSGVSTATVFGSGILMSRSQGNTVMPYVVVVGTVLLAFGAALTLPGALSMLGRRMSRSPLSLRLAARDASRQRSRSVAAVTSVMVTVGVVTAVLIVGTSSERMQADTYRPRSPHGTAYLTGSSSNIDIAPLREDAARIVAGARTALLRNPRHGSPGATRTDAPERQFAIQAEGCPVRAAFDRDHTAGRPATGSGGGGGVATGPGGGAPELPCRGHTLTGNALLLIDREGVDALPGLPDDVRSTLRDGGIVTTRQDLTRARLIGADVTRKTSQRDLQVGAVTEHVTTARTVDAAALAALAGQGTPQTVATTEAAAAVGVTVRPNVAVVTGPQGETLTPEQEWRLVEAAAAYQLSGQVERGHVSATATALLAVFGVALLLVLVAALSSTALSLAEQQTDLATLTAVGASRRTRRRIAGGQALLVAGLGSALGTVIGFVPGVAMAWPATTSRWDPTTMKSFTVAPTIVIPWLPLLVLLVVIPALAGLLAAAGIRRTPGLVLRQT